MVADKVTARPREYHGAFLNYLVQSKVEESVAHLWADFIERGFIEVAPGLLRHPNGSEVQNG